MTQQRSRDYGECMELIHIIRSCQDPEEREQLRCQWVQVFNCLNEEEMELVSDHIGRIIGSNDNEEPPK